MNRCRNKFPGDSMLILIAREEILFLENEALSDLTELIDAA